MFHSTMQETDKLEKNDKDDSAVIPEDCFDFTNHRALVFKNVFGSSPMSPFMCFWYVLVHVRIDTHSDSYK